MNIVTVVISVKSDEVGFIIGKGGRQVVLANLIYLPSRS